MKRIYPCILLILMLFFSISISSCKKETPDIVATTFSGYDFARAVVKDTNTTVEMLLKPGESVHGYEPSATDIRKALNCKVFIYVGGESDTEWVENEILPLAEKKNIVVLSMFEILGEHLLFEEEIENEESEYDEHVWMNPENAVLVIEAIASIVSKIRPTDAEKYQLNAKNYCDSLLDIDQRIQSICTNKKKIIVADRFPFLYFVKHYGLKYEAALGGCSASSETSAKHMIELIQLVNQEEISIIFTIELSTQSIAKTIQQEADHEVQIETLYSMQNVSKEDFALGLDYKTMLMHNYSILNKLFEV